MSSFRYHGDRSSIKYSIKFSRNKALGENSCKSQENNYNVNFCRCLPKRSLNLFTTCRSLWWFAEKTMTLCLLFPSSSSLICACKKRAKIRWLRSYWMRSYQITLLAISFILRMFSESNKRRSSDDALWIVKIFIFDISRRLKINWKKNSSEISIVC